MSAILGYINSCNKINKKFSYEDNYISLDSNNIYKTKELIILYDGRIENLSNKSDIEYIYSLFNKYHEKAFEKIKGSFAICIYDLKTKKIILARDKYGIKSLYYSKNNFSFACDIKPIIDNPLYEKEFNDRVLKSYFLYLTNPDDETLFKGIFKVPKGSYLTYDNCNIKITKYFNIEFNNTIYDKEELMKKIKDNIDKYFTFDKKIASFLSSGIDSSLIVSRTKVQDTYTVSFKEEMYNEDAFAKDLCNKLGIKNTSVLITKEEYLKAFKKVQEIVDEPSLDPAIVALFIGAKEASKKYKYIYSGEGSDELFAGYNSYKDILKYNSIRKTPKFIKKILIKICNILPEVKGVNFLLRNLSDTNEYYTGVSRIFNEKTLNKLFLSKEKVNIKKYNKVINNNNEKLEQMQTVDLNYWLSEEISSTTKMCEYNNMEVIMPFLNNDLYDISITIPSSFKINEGITKSILREVARDYIPNEAYQNKKLGFPVPIKKWLKTKEYYDQIKETFNSKKAKHFFNIKKLNKYLDNNYYEKKDYTKEIWCIYSFLVWYDLYF